MSENKYPLHPLRCDTCEHYSNHICTKQHNRMSNIEITLVEMIGCASHSDIGNSLRETYDRYKHLDDCLSDPIWCADGPAIYSVAGELWRAIKNEVERK